MRSSVVADRVWLIADGTSQPQSLEFNRVTVRLYFSAIICKFFVLSSFCNVKLATTFLFFLSIYYCRQSLVPHL